MCSIFKTPGPQYELRPVVGYNKHCLSKLRNPQYSFGLKPAGCGGAIGPGPKYSLGKFTRYGKGSPPAYSIYSRPKGCRGFQTPGPPTYKAELVPRMKEPRPPAYSIRSRQKGFTPFNTPGPNQYDLPTTIGPKIPDKNAKPAYSIAGKQKMCGAERSPGPAKYPAVNLNLTKYKTPQYGLRMKPPLGGKPIGPGPAAYMIRSKFQGGFSLRARVCAIPYITAEDNMPCVND